ncbi:MAG: 3'-5' exonuclease [Lautropia sp.]|nr:3'-5' exonuclease [Lautropia sp.]
MARSVLETLPRWVQQQVLSARRRWQRSHLKDPRWAFLFESPPAQEWVALDCETTGLDVRRDEIIAIGAVRIRERRILTRERLDLRVRPTREVAADSVRVHRLRQQDVADGMPVAEAMEQLLYFIGSRPLVGYYLAFDVAMLDRALARCFGLVLPQPRIEISALYYDWQFRQLPLYRQHDNAEIDLRFASIMQTLALPMLPAHDAVNDAVMAAMAFIKLRELRREATRPRS